MIDPGLAGRELDEVSFPLDRSKLAELARALHDDDPVWYDIDAARAAGFDDVPIQPTATVISMHWRTGGVFANADAIKADKGRLLHGEASWEYLASPVAGSELTVKHSVGEVTETEGRRGGKMTLVGIDYEFRDRAGRLMVRRHDTLVERGA
jgi:N-terminal half of MaoC dehydratase